jgi:hypothetical protein
LAIPLSVRKKSFNLHKKQNMLFYISCAVSTIHLKPISSIAAI